MIEKLSPNCPDEAFYKGMRCRRVGHSLELFSIDDAQIRLSPVMLERRIVV